MKQPHPHSLGACRALERLRWLLVGLVFLLVLPSSGLADVKLPKVFGDHMVLQCDKPLVVWGWAEAGEKVMIALGSQRAETVTDAKGKWRTVLSPLKAGGPLEMIVAGKNKVIYSDVLIGEVWLCSGQSNMEWLLRNTDNADEVVRSADDPDIRLLNVEKKASPQPLPDIKGAWTVCTPQAAETFSAVGFFFGKKLHSELKVPIGLINSSWGGTLIEPWTPFVGFALGDGLASLTNRVEQDDQEYRRLLPAKLGEIEAWMARVKKSLTQRTEIPLQPEWPRHPLYSEGHPDQPTCLYNGMIHPVVPFAFRGAIWYQGESNAMNKDGLLYYEKMKALVGGWRKIWGQGDFPFYFVEIAPLDAAYEADDLPKLWDAQRASLSIPNTGMAVTTDIANLKDIHPRNKKDVGNRLALWALARDYGRKELIPSGPLYKSMEVKDGRVVISFDYTGGGLVVNGGGDLTWFEIAGPEKYFKKAQARISADKVIVWSEDVPNPTSVRFGWNRAAQPNLMNTAGLPASPFRTDSW